MPRGSAKGERRGGRKKGVPNKRTQEAMLIATRLQKATPADVAVTIAGRLGKETLRHWMLIFDAIAEQYRSEGNVARCQEYAQIACALAAKLAPYESPTFRAVVISPPPPPANEAKRFTLSIFEQAENGGLRLVRSDERNDDESLH